MAAPPLAAGRCASWRGLRGAGITSLGPQVRDRDPRSAIVRLGAPQLKGLDRAMCVQPPLMVCWIGVMMVVASIRRE
jgi:hypothetical protein